VSSKIQQYRNEVRTIPGRRHNSFKLLLGSYHFPREYMVFTILGSVQQLPRRSFGRPWPLRGHCVRNNKPVWRDSKAPPLPRYQLSFKLTLVSQPKVYYSLTILAPQPASGGPKYILFLLFILLLLYYIYIIYILYCINIFYIENKATDE